MRPLTHINILAPAVRQHDALGNDVVGMATCLRSAGWDVRVFTDAVGPGCERIALPLQFVPDKYWQRSDGVMIYHHIANWGKGEGILWQTRNRTVIKYHNITPPTFFEPYEPAAAYGCRKAQEGTARMASTPLHTVWADSYYNLSDYAASAYRHVEGSVLAPFHGAEELIVTVPQRSAVPSQFGQEPVILFVGAFRPNKGHLRLLETFAVLVKRFRVPARLVCIGGADAVLASYHAALRHHAERLGITDRVLFLHNASGATLAAFYRRAAMFVCLSEHEGFCVPLVEAMAFGVPIIGVRETAIGETIGEAGIVFDYTGPADAAYLIAAVLQEERAHRKLGERARDRYRAHFHPTHIQARLLRLLEQV